MKTTSFPLSLIMLLTGAALVGGTRAQNWVQTSAPVTNWSAVTGSADLSVLAATVQGGGIWISSDRGTNWTETSAPATNWISIDASVDGSRILAAVAGGALFSSSDFGAHWTQTTAPVLDWRSVAVSADGSIAIAGSRQYLYISADFGVSWKSNAAPQGQCYSLAMSDDGHRMFVSSGQYSRFALSDDFGQTWTSILTPYNWNYDVACNPEGSVVVLRHHYGVAVSTDGGATWTVSSMPGTWGPLVCSSNPLVVVGSESSRVVMSANSGFDWATVDSPSKPWNGFALSRDAKRLIALASNSGIYSWQPILPVPVVFPTAQNVPAGTNVVFSCAALSLTQTAYQWQHDGILLPDETNSTLELPNIQLNQAGKYAVWLTNDSGFSLSSNVTLQVEPSIITAQSPKYPFTVLAGSNVVYSVDCISTAPVDYHWLKNGVLYSTTHNGRLELTNAYPEDSGSYSCLLSNVYGTVKSAEVALTVVPSSVETLEPERAMYSAALCARYDIQLDSAGWFEWGAGTNLDRSTPALELAVRSGQTNFTARIDGLVPYANCSYRAVVSNSAGVVYGSVLSFATSSAFVRVNGLATNWSALEVTHDATRAAGIAGGQIYVSTNTGLAWRPTGKKASFMILSTNGNSLLALHGRALYTSTNFGVTWKTNTMPADFSMLVGSADAKKLLSCYSGQLCTSTNGGMSWVQQVNAPIAGYRAVASSHDGTRLAAWLVDRSMASYMYASTNSGVNWGYVPAESLSTLYETQSIALSPAGDILLTFNLRGNAMRNTNFSSSWVQSKAGSYPAKAVASVDGRKWALLSDPIRISSDSGRSWFKAEVPADLGVSTIAISGDGNTIMAAGPGGVYISRYTPTVRLRARATSGNLVLSWPGPSPQYLLQHSSGLIDWASVSNQEVLNMETLDLEVSLPTDAAPGFYRLGPR